MVFPALSPLAVRMGYKTNTNNTNTKREEEEEKDLIGLNNV